MGEAWNPKHENSRLAEVKEIPAPNPITGGFPAELAKDRLAQLEADVAALKKKAGI